MQMTCVSEQGQSGILWTVFEGAPFSSRRIASFAKADDARQYLALTAEIAAIQAGLSKEWNDGTESGDTVADFGVFLDHHKAVEHERDTLKSQLDQWSNAELLGETERCELNALRARLTEGLDSDSVVASCSCLTKSPDIQFHKVGCKYRLIMERDQLRKELEAGRMCSVCAGSGKPPSGVPCVCGGKGTEEAEMNGLRQLAYKLQAQLEGAREQMRSCISWLFVGRQHIVGNRTRAEAGGEVLETFDADLESIDKAIDRAEHFLATGGKGE